MKYEMQWTTSSFLHKAQEWHNRYDEPDVNPGPKAYAARQASQWKSIASDADHLFQTAHSDYQSLIK